jgi:hypothetical protein
MDVWKMEKLKVSMLSKSFFILMLFLFVSSLFAKTIELEVFAIKSEAINDLKEEEQLELNGFSQAITSELEFLKLDSALFWEKVGAKIGQSKKEEHSFLKSFFNNTLLSQSVPALKKGEGAKEKKKDDLAEVKLTGILKADLLSAKLQASYKELLENLSETRMRTFYILSSIELDSGLEWSDLGVSKSEHFSGVIVKSWRELFEKELKGFEKVVIIENDFLDKPDYMNAKSVTLKWNSTFKKLSINNEKKTALFELSAQAIMVNTKSGQVINSFDFPILKREFDTQNKKNLSSGLASLVYNLIYTQRAKLMASIEMMEKNQERSQFEAKMVSRSSLTEMYLINSFLQEKFIHIKLTSQIKSYSSEGAILLINAEGTEEKILDSLSLEGGKFSLNEQKVLLFNRLDKSFAILPKDSNNKN